MGQAVREQRAMRGGREKEYDDDQCPISEKKKEKKKLIDEHNTDVCRSTKVLVMKTECFWSGVQLDLSGNSASVHKCTQPSEDRVARHEGTI